MYHEEASLNHYDSFAAWCQLAEQAPVPMGITLGPEHLLCAQSPTLAQYFVTTGVAMGQHSFIELAPPPHAIVLAALLDQVRTTGEMRHTDELEHAHPVHGSVVWRYYIWPLRQPDEAVVGLAIQIQELTPVSPADDRHAVQLREVNERLLIAGLREQTARSEAEETLAKLIQAQAALQRVRDELEQTVEERTRELAARNRHLQEVIATLEQTEQARQALHRRLMNAQEAERLRIARELHDQLGQELAVLHMELAALLASEHTSAALSSQATQLQQRAQQIETTVHRVALELRPTALDDVGLERTLKQYLQTWSRQSGIRVDFIAQGENQQPIPVELAIVVYRIVQEGLTNVLKHANAQLVSVVLVQRPEQLQVIVEDNGRGMDVDVMQHEAAVAGRLGLRGMYERVALVGGTLSIESAPGQGTTLLLRLPYGATEEAPSTGG